MDNKSYLIIICTIINFVIFIALLLLKFDSVAITGPLGDTFGGLFSPILGITSIFLIYDTYKAQKEQLSDQKKANLVEKSLIYFTEIKQLIDDTERQTQMFTFVIRQPFVEHNGMLAVNNFVATYESGVEGSISNSGNGLLTSIVKQISDIIFIVKKIDPSSELLTNDHRSFIEKRLIDLLKFSVFNSERTFRIVRSHLEDVQRNPAVNERFWDNINETIILLANYKEKMENLQQLGYINKSQITQVSTYQEFYGNRKINYEALNSINLKEFYKVSLSADI